MSTQSVCVRELGFVKRWLIVSLASEFLSCSSGSGFRFVKSLVTAASDAVPSADVVAYVADGTVR